ncbi:MAG: glutaredoxin family protein [Smithella sp.]|jgi:glutaredoxin
MKKYLFLLIPLFFFLYGTANATFYTWEDENGATQITDYPPPQGKSAKNVQVHKYESDNLTDLQNTEEQGSSSKDNKSKSQKKPEVVLYTKNDCNDCDKAREFLKSKNIPFTEYNMNTDKTSAARRKEVDDSEDVPFAIINKNQVFGFSESVYNRALKINLSQ